MSQMIIIDGFFFFLLTECVLLTIRMICDNSNLPFRLLTFESKYSRNQRKKRHLYLWSCDQVPEMLQFILDYIPIKLDHFYALNVWIEAHQEVLFPSHENIIALR